MYTRFMDVINGLKALSKDFSNFELVTKILRSLPKSWDPKVTSIQETKDLKTFPLEELIGSLMTYEMNNVAKKKFENNLPKNRKDFRLGTHENHSSISSSDGELKMKRKLKSKKNGTTCFKRKKKNKNWDESSSSEDEKVNKSEATKYALPAYDVEVIKMPLVYFEIT